MHLLGYLGLEKLRWELLSEGSGLQLFLLCCLMCQLRLIILCEPKLILEGLMVSDVIDFEMAASKVRIRGQESVEGRKIRCSLRAKTKLSYQHGSIGHHTVRVQHDPICSHHCSIASPTGYVSPRRNT